MSLPVAMNLRGEPLEKKKKTETNTKNPSSFPNVPDDITVNFLARLSRSHYTRLSLVSKSFASVLSSKELYVARTHLGNIENCLYVCLCDRNAQFSQWFTLWINPNQTLRKSSETRKIEKLLVPITSPNVRSITDYTSTVAVVGSKIYVIGGLMDEARSSSVRILDSRFHTWADGPNMNVARYHPASCVYDGNIYVVGGCQGLHAEVLDTKTQTWKRLPNPGFEIPQPCHFRIAEIEGKICVLHSEKMYTYDPEQDTWESGDINGAALAKFECVIENASYGNGVRIHVASRKCISMLLDIKDGKPEEVRGLESLSDMVSGKSLLIRCHRKLVSFGRKLLLVWEGSKNDNDMKDIWCAEVTFDKRNGGEVWGTVEWADVVHTVPASCDLVHCLAVSV